MKKKIIIICAAVAVLLAIVASIVFSPKASVDRSVIDNNVVKTLATPKYLDGELSLSEDDFTLVGEVGDNQLYLRSSDFTIKVKNISNGNEWQSFIDEKDYIHNADKGRTENTPAIAKRLKKLFEISYSDYGVTNDKTSLIDDSNADYKIKKLQNGFAIDVKFEVGISMTVEFWLDEDGLNARIPRDKIKEGKEYVISAATLLPMFGSTNDLVNNGFVLFPDAAGGIYNIKVPTVKQSPIIADVYFSRNFDLDKVRDNNQQGIKNAIMPFFGIARNLNGFVGYITEGEMNSNITFSPSGTVFALNRIEPTINYRKTYSYLNPAGEEVTELEREISAENFAVHYSFVTAPENGKVTYSNLANTLQKYLVKNGLLAKAQSAEKEGVNTNIQAIMSVKTDSMVGEFLQVMTKCDDIKNMVEGLDDNIKDKLRMLLLGWQTSGYNVYPSTGKITGKIGSVKELSKYLTEKGIDSYLVDDLIYASTDSKNFEKQSDAVYNEIGIPVTDSNGEQYIRNPYKEYAKLTGKTLPYFEKNSVCGIGFDKVGWYVFDDAQKNLELNRFDTSTIYRAMLSETKKAGFKTAVQRGNAYVLGYTDYLYDIPEKGSRYALLDAEIPFYQMVVHGYIPYSLDTPGNMAIDYKEEVLRWVETGAEPSFLVTQEMSEKFKDSKVENAFSTEIANWLDEIVEITKEFNTKLSFTGNCTISEHIELENGVYRVTYSNGNKVYVNYKLKEMTVDNVKIPAQSYTVVKADGSIIG